MANKIFSIYSPGEEAGEKSNERLVVEIAKSHIACIAKNESDNTISSFEIFRLNGTSNDFYEVFSDVQAESKLLHKPYTDSKVFIQNEMSVLVPANVFTKELADDFLNVAACESTRMVTMSDELNIDGGVVNAYRVPMNTLSILHLNMGRIVVEHTYSQIVRNLFSPSRNTPEQLIKVQFYYDHIIVAVVSGKALQLVQTFNYQTPADVLYYLLNVSQRLQLNAEQMVLEVSGMIDLDSPMYNELVGYFKNILIEEPEKKLTHHDAGKFPAHYFTPIFNLAI